MAVGSRSALRTRAPRPFAVKVFAVSVFAVSVFAVSVFAVSVFAVSVFAVRVACAAAPYSSGSASPTQPESTISTAGTVSARQEVDMFRYLPMWEVGPPRRWTQQETTIFRHLLVGFLSIF